MLKIAICDDEKELCEELELALVKILKQLKTKYEIDVFYTGHELCNKMEIKLHYDLIFLDIEFAKHEINGVEVGRIIRDTYNNNSVSIVYISWEQKYAMQLFEIRPLNFLIKPLEQDKIKQVVEKHQKLAGILSRLFIYKKGHNIYKVQIKDIVYLESRGRKVIIHFLDGKEEEIYGSLKEIYSEQLKFFDFLFIHAAFIVNYDYVTEAKYNQLLVLGNQTPLAISKNRQNDVRGHYLEIMKRRGAL